MKKTIAQMSLGSRFPGLIWVCLFVFLGAFVVASSGCGPGDPVQEVREEIAAGELESSLDSLRELLAEDPDDSELLYLYGLVLTRMGQPGLAEWPLRKAMADPVWLVRAAKLAASVEMAGGNFENAAELYARVLEADPDDIAVRILRANACARSPQLFEEALAEADRILERNPDELGAFKPRILAYLGMNDPENANRVMEELGRRIEASEDSDDPIRGWYCATMAIFASDSGDMELAKERWAECEEKYPSNPNVVMKSVEFHKQQGELDRALEVAEAAFSGDAENASDYRYTVAELLRLAGRPDEAEALLREVAEDEDETAIRRSSAWLALTEHFKTIGDLESAADALEHGLSITQQAVGPQPDLLFSLAELLIQIGQPDRALQLTNEMTVAAHRNLVRARVAQLRKQYGRALKLYEEVTRLWPENAYAPYHAAGAALAIGRFDRAFQNYLLSIRVDDGATDARSRAARLLAAEGRFETAIEMLVTGKGPRTPDAELYLIEILARARGATAGVNAAHQLGRKQRNRFGLAIEAVVRARGEADDRESVWHVLEPLLTEKLPPVNLIPILRAGLDWANDDRIEALRPLVTEAAASNPESADAQEIMGMLLERSGESEAAAERYRKALELDPDRSATLFRLARIEASTDSDAAVELIERGLAVTESLEKPLESRLFLRAVSAIGDAGPVPALLERALASDPANGAVAFRLAKVLEDRDARPDRIVALANRAIRFQAGGEEAVALRDRAKARI